VSALVFVEDEGVNSGAEVEDVEAMVCQRSLFYSTNSSSVSPATLVMFDARRDPCLRPNL